METAHWLGRILGTEVMAIHADEGDSEGLEAIAAATGTTIAVTHGDATNVITDRLAAEDVVLGVVGTRGWPGGRRPAGHIALAVARASGKPLVVVPPERPGPTLESGCRVLAAFDDTPQSIAGAEELERLFVGSEVDILVVHVFDWTNVPPFWDQAHHAAESWGRELAARHLRNFDTPVELRGGAPGICLVEVAAAESVDLIAMSWSQDLSAGKAQTVQHVLAASKVPVLLLPLRAATLAR
ncbi:MAG: universal stress protein [Acidimicrobiales bacterium]